MKYKLVDFYVILVQGIDTLRAQGICNEITPSKFVEYTEVVTTSGKVFNSTQRLSVCPVEDGFWVTGTAYSSASHGDQLFISKFNDTGRFMASAATSAGGIVVSGQSVNTSVSSNMTHVSKFDKYGNLTWSRTTPAYNNRSAYDQFRTVYVDKANNDDIYLAGTSTQRLGASSAELFLGKLDSAGNYKFLKYVSILDGTVFNGSHGLSIVPTKGKAKLYGDFLVLFWSGSGSAQRGGLIYMNKDGKIGVPWLGKLESGNVPFTGAVFSESGSLYVVGTNNLSTNSNDIVLYSLDPSNFKINWQYAYGTAAYDYQHTLVLENSHLWVTAMSSGVSGNVSKRVVLKIDTLGNLKGQWSFNNPLNSSESFETLAASRNDFAVLSNGTTVYVGYVNSGRQNISLMYASPCSKKGCYFDTMKSFVRRSFNYSGNNCNYSLTNGSNFPVLSNVDVYPMNMKPILRCIVPCVAPRRVLKTLDSMCNGGKVMVSAKQLSFITRPIQYLWNDGDTNAIKTFTAPGKYYLTTSNKCDTILDSIQIKEVLPLTAFNIKDSLYCNQLVNWDNPYTSFRANYKWENGLGTKTRTINNPGKYWLTIGNYCGTITDTFLLTRKLSPEKILKTTDTLCLGTKILSADAYQKDSLRRPATYQWLDGTKDSIFQASNPGKFWVKTRNICGDRIDTISVVPLDKPQIFDVKDSSYCDVPKDIVIDVSQPNCRYLWRTGKKTPRVILRDTERYWENVTTLLGTPIDSLMIVDYYSPEKRIKDLDSVCSNGVTSVYIDGKQIEKKRLPSIYNWNSGETTSAKNIDKPGVHVLITQNRCGKRSDSIRIIPIFPPQKFQVRDTLFCDALVSYKVNVYQQKCGYVWNDGDTNYARTLSKVGKYQVSVINQCGTETDDFKVALDSTPMPILPADREVCDGKFEIMDLPPLNPSWSYSWRNSAVPVSNKFYLRAGDTLVLSIKSNCATVYDTIKGERIFCLPCAIYMANAFTPFNKDQINKEIKPISNCKFKTGYWSVYNRWGQVILDRVPLTQAWDAMYMGEPVIPGVYIYMIYGIFDRSDAGVFQISGNITVLE